MRKFSVLNENIYTTSLKSKEVQLALQTGKYEMGTQFRYVYCKPYEIRIDRDISRFLRKGDVIESRIAEINTEYELDRPRYLELLQKIIQYLDL